MTGPLVFALAALAVVGVSGGSLKASAPLPYGLPSEAGTPKLSRYERRPAARASGCVGVGGADRRSGARVQRDCPAAGAQPRWIRPTGRHHLSGVAPAGGGGLVVRALRRGAGPASEGVRTGYGRPARAGRAAVAMAPVQLAGHHRDRSASMRMPGEHGYVDDPIERYLDQLLVTLPGSPRQVRHTLAEVETHLLDACLLYTSDAADEEDSVDLGGRRIIKKK